MRDAMELAGALPWQLPDAAGPPVTFLPGEPPVLRGLLWERGYRAEGAARTFLDPLSFRLPEAPLEPALGLAADRLILALERREKVRVWGDYDADGQTATAVLVGALRGAGIDADYHIPSCEGGGRGLDAAGLRSLAAAGCRLLITCDCGTNDVAAVAEAVVLGMEVIITDHHDLLGPLPAAMAVLNPTLAGPRDALYGLSGVAVAYLLVRELLRRLDRPQEANGWLDLVAIGTIADLAPHTAAVRALLARGLPRLWRSPRPGIRAALDLANKHPSGLQSDTVGFVLGPMLNAAGRLGSPRQGVELLLCRDRDRAGEIAADLWRLKRERSDLAAALERTVIERLTEADMSAPVLVVDGTDWHQGLLGRVAGSISRRYDRTVVLLSVPSGGGLARGSARAIGPVDLLATLGGYPSLEAFGGHPGAAGFSIRPEAIEGLRQWLRGRPIGEVLPPTPLRIEAIVPWDALSAPAAVAGQVERLAPFAEGNPEPVLGSFGLRLVGRRPLGSGDQHLLLTLADAQGFTHEMKWWRYEHGWEAVALIDVAYTATMETWQGRTTQQLTLRDVRPHRA